MNNNRSFIDQLVRVFFYTAPLIGLLYGVYYLKTKNKIHEITIDRDKLESVLIDFIEDLDDKDCIEDGKLKIEVNKWVLDLN